MTCCSRLLLLICAALIGGCAAPISTCRDTAPGPDVMPPGTVLIALSAAETMTLADGSTRATGYFLNEFYGPWRALTEAGYAVVIATPDGRPAIVDPESLDPRYWDGDAAALDAAQALAASAALQQPITLAEARARAADYQGLVVPGGQGVMVDLIDDADLHALMIELGRADRPVGLICHAPALLTRLPLDQDPFVGRAVTAVSGFEEFYIETFVMGAEAQNRAIGDQLEARGHIYDSAVPGRGHAVRDCNLVTSQNPFSGDAFDAHYLAALQSFRAGGRCDCAVD